MYSLEVRDARRLSVMTTTSMYKHTGECKHCHPWLGLGQDNGIWEHQLPLLSQHVDPPPPPLYSLF